MSVTSISVARMLELKVPIAWQEAVELARAADQAATSSGAPLSVEGAAISADGRVHVAGGGRGQRGVSLTVREFLGRALEGQKAPPELRAYLSSGSGPGPRVPTERVAEPLDSPAASSPVVDLDWFASPNPELDLARLASRALEAAAEHDARTAIERLRAEAGEAPVPTGAVAPRRPWARQEPRRLLGIAVAASLLVGAGVVVGTWLLSATELAHAEMSATTPASPLAGAIDAVKRALAGGDASDAPAASATTAISGVTTPVAPQSSSSATRPAHSALVAAPAAVPVAVQAGVTADSEADVLTSETAATGGVGPVYSDRDDDVEPPALLNPQLPSAAQGDSSRRKSYLEVTVDERGQVLRVRLQSSDPSLNDRMILAAAKAWQFQPALKDGRAVAYLLRIPVTR